VDSSQLRLRNHCGEKVQTYVSSRSAGRSQPGKQRAGGDALQGYKIGEISLIAQNFMPR